MTACTDYRSIFDLCLQEDAFSGLREVSNTREQPLHYEKASERGVELCPGDERQREGSLAREVPERMVCTACRCPFDSRDEQMEHYKLDWHRFNLRQKMMGLPPSTVEEFESKTGAGDMSSISGSESDSEEEDSDNDVAEKSSDVTSTDCEVSRESDTAPGRFSPKVVFQDSEGQYLAMHRCVLQGKFDDEEDLVASLKTISNKTLWVVLMTGGGHFAGAVFKGKEVLQHKTFHRYTVRAKRGTAQGLKDSQNRSHAPKSAGAALRRYNEAALVKEIQDLLESWAEHLKEASAVFLRAPSYNKRIFFGDRGALLDKKDPRVRKLPFATRRATFKEIQRVHNVLSTVHVYGKETEVSAIFSPSKKVWKKAAKTTAEPKPDQETKDASAAADDDDSSEEDEGSEIQLETVEVTLGTLGLREYEIQPSRQRKRRRRRKKEGNNTEDNGLESQEGNVPEEEEDLPEATQTEANQSPQEKPRRNKGRRKAQTNKRQIEEEGDDESWEYSLRDALYTACKTGNVDSLRSLLQLPEETGGEEEEEEGGPGEPGCRRSQPKHQQPPGALDPRSLLNRPIDSSGFTLLHVASAAGQKAVIWLLMDAGADPACRDSKSQTPYVVAPEKDTRNIFRKYMAENPEKYDYSKAQVPGPLTEEIESKKAEKKKAQKAAKKQREKEQKEEKKKQELEAEEKKRFASLSDREKRALAAERRLAEQVASTGGNISNIKRCWQCGESLLGKIPFEYLNFTFCTPRCVQSHRKANVSAPKT